MSLTKQISILLTLMLCIALASACSRKGAGTADVQRLIPASMRIYVAPFTQPHNAGQLIAGRIPENQGIIPKDSLTALDLELRHQLQSASKRNYTFITRQNLPEDLTSAHSSVQPIALPRWIAYGERHGAQLLLVPQVLDWHERDGSNAGVVSSAHVRVEFFLLNIASASLGGRSIFEEKQVGLTENLLTVGNFIKRGGVWVSAQELSIDGMKKAIKELGL